MSTFVGFSCLRSSSSLTGVLRFQGQITGARSSSTTLDWITGSARCFSLRATSRSHDIGRTALLTGHASIPLWRSPPARSQCQRRTLFGRKSQPVLTEYVHLPADYKDAEGLPFRKDADLDWPETNRIFPGMSSMTPDRAIRLLKILHGRRVAGTLDDPSLRVNTKMYSQLEIEKALKYLRREVPVDEILNAGLRAEDELRELEAGLTAKESDSAESPPTEAEGVDVEQQQKKEDTRSIYGDSILDKIREANIARAEAEAKAEAEQRKKEEEAAAQNWGGLTSYDHSLHRGLHPKQLEHYEAATSDLEAPPEIPRWRVLLPTTAFVATLLVSLYLMVNYVAPPRPGSTFEANATVGAILLLNVGMFIAWKRVRLWRYLNRHFILDFVTPRPHQILTAMLTHQDPRHLLKTMFALVVGGSLLIPEIGPAPFVATYIASGVCGFLATMYTHVARGMLVYMFGASSAGFGVICAYFWLYRFDGFKILGLPPDPMQGVQGLGFIGLLISFFALVPMVRRQGGNVDWTSHLVGMLTGIGCAALMEGQWKANKISHELEEKTKDTT
ncbi:hypothetical protein N0V93_001148 [Gnomoniopsis smithogilvyi]|uniref:Peptidase S54 rhomboid domain-containing protein n=1 Tax=Gnomoniopsis smithogilvyi TaxID=1191159 RepID=A0A9W8Z133_9PEZI|nr:hypothetical protein N0V93_001148 [Gnomoniopsis smithogilvyi]